MQPMPATTQGCLATMVAVARRAGSMVRAVVMSLAALSSKSAASRRVVMRRDFQSMEGFYDVRCTLSVRRLGLWPSQEADSSASLRNDRQKTAESLAANAWGNGERSTEHGERRTENVCEATLAGCRW